MLKIRLSRIGKRNEPHFRVVVAEHTSPAKGKFVESLGFYNPRSKTFKIDEEKLKLWLSRGARPSPTVHNKLIDLGIIKGPKLKVSKRKTKEKEVEKKETSKKEAVEEKKEEKAKVKTVEKENKKPANTEVQKDV